MQLPDGTFAVVERSITWGESVVILLLAALLFVELYKLWRQR